ncbi:hypothetical protein [Roseococcus sp.]|uniref:hypothetical protein n=1 Tax=Roseococcus sp. TaxID=2109646 RepID=UPI003BACEE2E
MTLISIASERLLEMCGVIRPLLERRIGGRPSMAYVIEMPSHNAARVLAEVTALEAQAHKAIAFAGHRCSQIILDENQVRALQWAQSETP